MKDVRVAMTIAGSDSSGGAGIQADLKTFAALGVYGTSVITAVTAQNTQRVTDVVELSPQMVAAQIDAVVADITLHVVKTGMLANSRIISAIAEKVQEHHLPNLVVDPVMVAKGGDCLLREDAVAAMREVLLPLALVATPNIPEAEALVGYNLDGPDAIVRAARDIHSLGVVNVVIKGGHLQGPATDLLYDGSVFRTFESQRVDTTSTHGTGCTFASAIAASLAQGLSVEQAIAQAKEYVTRALVNAYPMGHGHGSVHHFHRWWK